MSGDKIKEAHEYLEEWLVRNEGGGEWRAYCPIDEEPGTSNSPSASFNFNKDKWHCLKSNHGGKITTLVERLKAGEQNDRQRGVIRRDVSMAADAGPFPYTDENVEAWHKTLLADPDLVEELEELRGWSKDTLVDFMIGYDRNRYTIPIYDADGQLVNVRQYLPGDVKKMINVPGHGKARIFGLDMLQVNDEILWCAGEPDRILAVQEGFPAVTSTGGEGYFDKAWGSLFTGKTVYVCYDADDAGRKGADKVVSIIKPYAAETHLVTIPELHQGYDITDLLMDEGPQELRDLIAEAELVGTQQSVFEEVRDRFPRLDLAQLLRDDRPAREYVIEDLIPAGTSVSLVAQAGTGKSLFGLAGMIAVARGDEQFAGLEITKRRVLYVDMENTEDDLVERFRDLGVTLEEVSALDNLVFLHLPSLHGLDSFHGGCELSQILDAYGIGRGDVVVLDSFQRVTDGPEDKSDTMRGFYTNTGLMLKQRGVTVIRTDNTGHAENGRARGSSGKKDDVDIELIMERIADGRFTIKPGKVRIAGLKPVTLEQQIDDHGRVSYLVSEEREKETRAFKLDRFKLEIVKALTKKGEFKTKSLIYQVVNGRQDMIRTALGELQMAGYVSETAPFKMLKDYPSKLKVETGVSLGEMP